MFDNKIIKGTRIGIASLAALGVGMAVTPMATASPIVDETKSVTLNIHKYDGGGDASVPNDGRKLTDTSNLGSPLSGIAFDLYKLDANVHSSIKAAGELRDALELTKSFNPYSLKDDGNGVITTTMGEKTFTFNKVKQVITGDDGTVSSGEMEQGLYFVKENLVASTNENKDSITPSIPFLILLPMTETDSTTGNERTAWDYERDVYPKNQISNIQKEVLDGNIGTENQDAVTVGDNMTYRLLPTIPSAPTGLTPEEVANHIGYYAVGDKMQDGMEFVSSTIKLPDGTNMVAGTDYTETVSNSKNFIQWSLTTEGLTKIAEFGSGTLEIDVIAKVTDGAIPEDGIIKNSAWLVPGHNWWLDHGNEPLEPGTPPEDRNTPPETPPGIPSNEVESKYGDIIIRKIEGFDLLNVEVDSAPTVDMPEDGSPGGHEKETMQSLNFLPNQNTSEPKTLAGAEFSLYRAVDGECTVEAVSGDPLKVSGPTAEDGIAKFENLQYSVFYNGIEQLEEGDYQNYCIVETVAPDGYELLTEPIKVTLNEDTDGEPMSIVNVPHNLTGELPLAGGLGTYLPFIGVGFLVLAGAGGAYIASRKKDEETLIVNTK